MDTLEKQKDTLTFRLEMYLREKPDAKEEWKSEGKKEVEN